MELVHPIRDKKQIDSIKKILKATNLRNYCLFTLGINSGLRISDLLNLKIKDVIDKRGRVRDRISIVEIKTGKKKDFPFSDVAKKSITEYLSERKYRRNQHLFLSRKWNGPLTRQQAYRIINDAARSVGIKEKIGTHTLRKTFGYHAYHKGIDLSLLQKLFNHATPGTTLTYIGITQEQVDNVYLTLNL